MSMRPKPIRERRAQTEPEQDSKELPEGWTEAPLDGRVYLAGRIGWRGLTAAEYKQTGPMFLSVPNLNHGDEVDFTVVHHVSQERYDESPEIKLRNNDILLTKDGAGIGKLGFIKELPGPATVNSSLLVIRALEAFEPKYLFYCLKGPEFQGLAQERITGSTTPHLFQKDIKNLGVRIAPKAEQRRIVSKLEEVLGKVQQSQRRLARIPVLLKRFRQSVLAAACSGKLTADWRAKNDCVEPASDLISRLGSKRRERHRELCVTAKKANRGRPQEFDNIEPSVRNDLDTFDLPSDWSWVDLRFVMTVDEPFCYGVVQPGANEPNGNFLVRAGDLQSGTVNISELRRIPTEVDSEYERSRLKGGELLITVVGAGIGTVAIAPASCAGFNIARAVAKVPIRDVSAEYVFQWFNTSKALSWMVGDAREVARPTLNLEQLRTILVPLPPLCEQQEIVRRIEQLFAFADQIEARFKKAQAQVDRLTQSVLAKAFRGELVPTEAELARRENRSFEPASELLARIQSERVTQATAYPSLKITKSQIQTLPRTTPDANS